MGTKRRTKEHLSDANALAVMGFGLVAGMFFPISFPAALLASLIGASVAKASSRRETVDHLNKVADSACETVVEKLRRQNRAGSVSYTEWKEGMPITRIHDFDP
jgi:hypothetical protein